MAVVYCNLLFSYYFYPIPFTSLDVTVEQAGSKAFDDAIKAAVFQALDVSQ